MPKSKSPLRLLWLLPVALIGVGGIGVAAMMQPPPSDLDLSLTRTSEHGLFVGTLEPGVSPIPVGTIQSWTVAVTTPAMMMGLLISSAPKRKVIALAVGIPVFALAGIGFGTFFSGPLQWTLGHLACGYLMLGVVAALANMLLKSRHLPMAWLIFSLIYIPTVVGMSDSIAATAIGRPISEIDTDRGVVSGSVVRVTSAYLLIAHDNTIITMPMNKVREVRRHYVQSPEADFLTGGTASEL